MDFTLHCCISITEEVKINDLQKSIVTGLLYVHIEFEAIWTFLQGSYLDFEPLGVLCLVTSARSKGKTPKYIFVERSGVARSEIGSSLLKPLWGFSNSNVKHFITFYIYSPFSFSRKLTHLRQFPRKLPHG